MDQSQSIHSFPHIDGIPYTVLRAIERLGGVAGKTEIRKATGNHLRRNDFDVALAHLVAEGLITVRQIPTSGRHKLEYTLRENKS